MGCWYTDQTAQAGLSLSLSVSRSLSFSLSPPHGYTDQTAAA